MAATQRDMNRRGALHENARGTIQDETFTGKLKRKWGRYLENIKNPHTQAVTAILYESQFNELRRVQTEDTLAVNAGAYTKYVFPVLRRVFPNLIANEIVSVQPMTAPFGAVFYFEYKHARSKGRVAAGSNMIQNFDKYYSSEFIDREHLATPDGTNFGGAGSALSVTAAYTPLRPKNTVTGVSVIIQDVDADGTVVQQAIDDGSGGFTGDTSAGAVNYTTGQITGFKFTAAPTSGTGRAILISYSYDGEANIQTADVNVDISFTPISAESRRLKARWSVESTDDLRAFQGLDAETELVAGISQEIGLELDRTILGELLAGATTTTATFDFTVPAGISEIDHYRAVLTRMSQVSFGILKESRRAPANFAVTGPDIAARLIQLQTSPMMAPIWGPGMGMANPEFQGVQVPMSYGQSTSNQGIMRMGPLANKWSLYQDVFFKQDTILMGLKGDSYLDAGYVFAPYVALQMTPTFLDPEDQAYRKGMRTRYAKLMLRPEWYGKVTVTGGL